jgi:acyl-CoA synthetase (AMP-forming)/AMP-acid ligase II
LLDTDAVEEGVTTIVELLCERSTRLPGFEGYRFKSYSAGQHRTLSYRTLANQAEAVAAELQAHAEPGTRVILLQPPGPEFLAGFMGCLYAGVIVIPASPPHREADFERLNMVIEDSGATVILAPSKLRTDKLRLHMREPAGGLKWIDLDLIAEDRAAAWRKPDLTGESIALIQYTSGSTGTPKGIKASHSNLLYNLEQIHQCFGHSRGDRGVIWLPPYHDMGLIGGILSPLYSQIPVTLLSPMDFIQQPFRWLETLSEERATVSGGPNFAYDLCIRKVTSEQRARLDLSHWRVAFSGAETVRASTLARFAETFRSCGFRPEAFLPCYGLAESTLLVAGNTRERPPEIRVMPASPPAEGETPAGPRLEVVSCGTPRGQRVLIVHPETLEPCVDEQIGEIWVAGPSVAQGYWGREAETQAVFRARCKGAVEGEFLRTGDLGFLAGGQLFVTGRLKEVLVIRGRNVFPQDIELTAQRCHAALRLNGGAAFLVESGEAEPRLVLVHEIESAKIGDKSYAELRGDIQEAITKDHGVRVHEVRFVAPGKVPRTPSGKIRRGACREQWVAGNLEAWEPVRRQPGRSATEHPLQAARPAGGKP